MRVRFGGRRVRGVVVEVSDEAPEGIDAQPVEAVVDQLPPALVDLALWLADYYGSTHGRALALVAPELGEAARSSGRSRPSARRSAASRRRRS